MNLVDEQDGFFCCLIVYSQVILFKFRQISPRSYTSSQPRHVNMVGHHVQTMKSMKHWQLNFIIQLVRILCSLSGSIALSSFCFIRSLFPTESDQRSKQLLIHSLKAPKQSCCISTSAPASFRYCASLFEQVSSINNLSAHVPEVERLFIELAQLDTGSQVNHDGQAAH